MCKVDATLKLNWYAVLDAELESACLLGVNRAHKHTDTPAREHIAEEVHRCVMSALCELLRDES
jgi:hypothetical protein